MLRVPVTVCLKKNEKDTKLIFFQNNFGAFLQIVGNKFRIKNVRIWTQEGCEITSENINSIIIEENIKIFATSDPGGIQTQKKLDSSSFPRENHGIENSPQKKDTKSILPLTTDPNLHKIELEFIDGEEKNSNFGIFMENSAELNEPLTQEDSSEEYENSEKLSRKFEIPTRQICIKAIGMNQSPHLKPFLFPDEEFFKPIPVPRQGDWLDENKEKRQPFIQFKKKCSKLKHKQQTIYLLPIGDFDPARAPNLHMLKECASAYFNTCVQLLPKLEYKLENNNHVIFSWNGIDLPIRTRMRTRYRQLLAGDIHHFLKLIIREFNDAFCICGVTMEDLYSSDDSNFIFGQASQNNFVGVFSFVRYSPHFGLTTQPTLTQHDYDKLMWRSCGTLVHEIAHLYGLDHCLYFDCVMNGTSNLDEQDRQSFHACPVCVHKLSWACGWDVKKRELNLLMFYKKFSGVFGKEKDWLERRLQKLKVINI